MDFTTELRPSNFLQRKHFPKITKPKVVGYFSLDCKRQYLCTAANLKYLKIPEMKPLQLDLNKGYENVIHKPESANEEKLDHVLRFILDNKHNMYYGDKLPNSPALIYNFVCFRGLLRQLMCIPYEYQEDLCILVTRYRGTYYLCSQETEAKKYKRLHETQQQKRLCSYGFKFEQYILTDDPTKEPNTDQPVNESEEFCCMFDTNINGLRLLYGAEMDGVASDKICNLSELDVNELEFVEVKVTSNSSTPRAIRTYHKFKTRNWWCQSFLVGIKNIFLGLRTEEGIVQEIRKLDLTNLAKESVGHWNGSVCMSFLEEFLRKVHSIMKDEDNPDTVYKFYWNPKTHHAITYSKMIGKNPDSFIPDWYKLEIETDINCQL